MSDVSPSSFLSPAPCRSCARTATLSKAGTELVGVLVGLVLLASASGFAAPVRAAEDGAATDVIFHEAAEAVGLDFVHFNGMIGELYFPELVGGGVALLDYDNDGDLDVYLGQGAMFGDDPKERLVFPAKYSFPHTDRLYRNDLVTGPDGSREMKFVDVTEQAGLEAYGYNMGVASGDYDNDGWVDLYLTNLGSNHLLRNVGDGTFEETTSAAGADDASWTVAASFFDPDRDGWLDLLIGNYTEFRKPLHKPCTSDTGAVSYCGPLSYHFLPNRFLRNRGDSTFENITSRALGENPESSTLGTVIGDFNNDGWIDVYVANDQDANHLWINQKDGTFLEDAQLSGAAVDAKGRAQASMGVVAGDLDGDGHEDLFMSHLRMEMNTIYINDGTGLFQDQSGSSGLGQPSFPHTGFGTALFDYDNDGVVDLYIANGAVKRIEAELRAGDKHPLHEPNSLFRGTGGGRYQVVPASRMVDRVYSEVSRGVAAGDIDNDGDTDLIVANNAGQVRLLVNQVGNRNDWIGLRLLLGDIDRDAIGAKVTLSIPGQPPQFRRVRTDGSYAAASDPRALFGLGSESQAPSEIQVNWPDGKVETFSADQMSVGAYTTLRQGQGKSSGAGQAP